MDDFARWELERVFDEIRADLARSHSLGRGSSGEVPLTAVGVSAGGPDDANTVSPQTTALLLRECGSTGSPTS